MNFSVRNLSQPAKEIVDKTESGATYTCEEIKKLLGDGCGGSEIGRIMRRELQFLWFDRLKVREGESLWKKR